MKIYEEFTALMMKRQATLNREDCPWSDEEFAAYKEGWTQAFMWAREYLSQLLNEKRYDSNAN